MAPDARLHRVASGLSFPTSLAFGRDGTAYVAESGLPFGGAPPGGRVWAIDTAGARRLVCDGLDVPVTGLTTYGDALLLAEGSGRIAILEPDGHRKTVLEGLPGPGNYHTNMALGAPDGWIYFSQGAMTNAGIVGLDAYELGWLRRLPHAHDIPGFDVVLRGAVAETEGVPGVTSNGAATTGAFAPFGTPTPPGMRVAAGLPCTAGVMRCRPDGGELELVAWGLRNAFGLTLLPDGRLLAVDQGADERGSRPIGGAPDLLFEVRSGAWYGWPDFIDGVLVGDERFRPSAGSPPEPLLANHDDLPAPERALVRFAPHAAATRVAPVPGYEGRLAAALFGDERPMTAPAGPPAGRALAVVELEDGSVGHVAGEPLHRPIDVAFHPLTGVLHVLDFGRFEMHARGLDAEPGSGALWIFDGEIAPNNAREEPT